MGLSGERDGNLARLGDAGEDLRDGAPRPTTPPPRKRKAMADIANIPNGQRSKNADPLLTEADLFTFQCGTVNERSGLQLANWEIIRVERLASRFARFVLEFANLHQPAAEVLHLGVDLSTYSYVSPKTHVFKPVEVAFYLLVRPLDDTSNETRHHGRAVAKSLLKYLTRFIERELVPSK